MSLNSASEDDAEHRAPESVEADSGGAVSPHAALYCCVREGAMRGSFRSFEGDRITFGRGSDADFTFAPDDVQVSRAVHCQIDVDPSDATRRRWTLSNFRKNPVHFSQGEGTRELAEGETAPIAIPCAISIGHGSGSITLEVCTEAELSSTRTSTLLLRSWSGDDAARSVLVEEHLPYILERVRKRMGAGLRVRADSLDMAQEAALRFLRGGAPVLTTDPLRLRAFLACVVENTLRDENDRQTAAKRDRRRERSDRDRYGVLLDLPQRSQDTPSEVAMKLERTSQLELALGLLAPEDRQVIELRSFEELGFAEIGEQLELTENAARMRFKRALPKLRSILATLHGGSGESTGAE